MWVLLPSPELKEQAGWDSHNAQGLGSHPIWVKILLSVFLISFIMETVPKRNENWRNERSPRLNPAAPLHTRTSHNYIGHWRKQWWSCWYFTCLGPTPRKQPSFHHNETPWRDTIGISYPLMMMRNKPSVVF